MEQRSLSVKEVEITETLIRVLERTLPSLDQNERVIVKRCILRMKNAVAVTDRRRQEHDRRKADQKRKFLADRGCPAATAGQRHDQ